MKLDFSLVVEAAGLVFLYFVARFLGKYIGAFSAMSISDVPVRVRNYLGLALLPHGGVAVGLILLVQADPRLQDVAEIVTTVGLAALAINQLLGPSGTRFSLSQSGERGQRPSSTARLPGRASHLGQCIRLDERASHPIARRSALHNERQADDSSGRVHPKGARPRDGGDDLLGRRIDDSPRRAGRR